MLKQLRQLVSALDKALSTEHATELADFDDLRSEFDDKLIDMVQQRQRRETEVAALRERTTAELDAIRKPVADIAAADVAATS